MTTAPITSARRQVLTGTLDQAASSGSNLIVTLLVARATTQTGFGVFALVMMTYTLILGLNRSLYSEPFMVWAGLTPERATASAEARRLAVRATGTGVLVVVLAGGLLAGFVDAPFHRPTLVLLCCLPLLAVGDFLRYVAFAWRRPGLAFLSDVGWLLGIATVGAVTIVRGSATATSAVVAWCLAGILSMLALALLLRGVVRRDTSTLAGRRGPEVPLDAIVRQSRASGVEYLILVGGLQLAFFIAAAGLGTADIGGPRGALLLLGPLTVLFTGVSQALFPILERTGRQRPHLIVALQGLFVASTAALVALVLALPDAVGRELLGETWAASVAVIVPIGLSTALLGAAVPLIMQVRVWCASPLLLRRRFVIGLAYPVLAIAASSRGITWFVWTLVAVQAFDTAIVAVTARRLRQGLEHVAPSR